jgi:hypothetical protein
VMLFVRLFAATVREEDHEEENGDDVEAPITDGVP